MAGRERRRTEQPEALTQASKKVEQVRTTTEQARREQAMREQAAVPKKGPLAKAVEDTAKAEAEVGKGESLARRIPPPPVMREPPKVVQLPIRPEIRTETPVPQQAQPDARRENQEKPRPEILRPAAETLKTEETVVKVATERSEIPAKPVQESRPEKQPAPKSAFRKAWDSFIGLFTRRTRAGRKEPPPSKGPAKAPERKASIPLVLSGGSGKALAGPPPPEEPGGYRILPGDAPIDLAAVQIAQIDCNTGLQGQLPGLGEEQALEGQAILMSLEPTILAYEARVRNIMTGSPDAFRPVRRMRLGNDEIALCRPIRMGDNAPDSRPDIVIPVFITSGGKTRLVVGYQSQSQGTWRRFAGCDNEDGHYYKGPHHGSENLQDLDWRIQKEMDFVAGSERPTLMPNTALREFGPIPADGAGATQLVVEMENLVQSSALSGAPALDISVPENMPSRMLDYHLVGAENDIYGRHACALMESGNGRYLYSFALTDLGMFLQYVHDRQAGLIVRGSPSRGVIVPDRDDWLLTPIIEYRSQTRPVLARRLSRVERRGSLIAEGYRSYLVGVHSSSGSPFFRLDNALSPVFPLLRAGIYDRVDSLLGEMRRGERPISADARPPPLPADRVAALADARRLQLVDAFNARSSHSMSDEEIMRRYSVTRRDLQVFGRYEEQWREQSLGGQNLQHRINRRVRRLRSILSSMRGRPLDRGREAVMDLISRENLAEREVDALNGLAGSGKTAAKMQRTLEDAVRDVFRDEMSERLGWQATLWAQAELATGRIK